MGGQPVPIPATPDIGYSGADWPDPLASDWTRAQRLWDAWTAMMAARRANEMGYYAAGGPPPGNLVMANQPAYSGPGVIEPGNVTYVTPALQKWRDRTGYSMGYPRQNFSRRMNVGNVRALRRSMRRVQAFAKLAKKTISFTHHVKMKKHRRK